MTDLNPHREQMADESMVRTLDAQNRAIWPQESALLGRYGLPDDIRILDAGCGTGEGSWRLAEMFPRATVLGVDVLDSSIDLARSRHGARHGARLAFENQSIYELRAPDETYDLVVNRHVIHSIPHPERVLAELKRVTKRGGRLHLIPEDYGMLHFQKGDPDPTEFWQQGPAKFGAITGTDLFIGRNAYGHLVDLGFTDITMDYIVVDTLRVPRETFAAIIEAWRDGYAGVSAEAMGITVEKSRAYFDRMIENIRDPRGYAVWMVPVVGARVP
ncbi:MAG TPA: methyltransferase domain-containing protein [Acidobacteriota bacterium]|nr:methyltransferase domain-containing protein [Acidobacteriota bacterium]